MCKIRWISTNVDKIIVCLSFSEILWYELFSMIFMVSSLFHFSLTQPFLFLSPFQFPSTLQPPPSLPPSSPSLPPCLSSFLCSATFNLMHGAHHNCYSNILIFLNIFVQVHTKCSKIIPLLVG